MQKEFVLRKKFKNKFLIEITLALPLARVEAKI